ncbi:hypothetical protein AB6D11_02650 [Vibrio splendidus]
MTNKQRAESAFRALKHFEQNAGLEGEGMETQIKELLCNMKHLCDEQGLDFPSTLSKAHTSYKEGISLENIPLKHNKKVATP